LISFKIHKFIEGHAYGELFDDMLEIKNIILIGIYSKNIERVDYKNERNELFEEMF
jgi:hypothetical protein